MAEPTVMTESGKEPVEASASAVPAEATVVIEPAVFPESTMVRGLNSMDKAWYQVHAAEQQPAFYRLQLELANERAAIADEWRALAVQRTEIAERWASMCEARMSAMASDASRMMVYANETARCLMLV